MGRKKTAREKLHIERQPELCDMPARMVPRYGVGKLLIPTPLQVDAVIREIPHGSTARVSELRDRLAARAGAAATCPLCFGIFWRLSAEAAEEERAEGVLDIAPYWRVMRDDGKFNEKLPGGSAAHQAQLKAEQA